MASTPSVSTVRGIIIGTAVFGMAISVTFTCFWGNALQWTEDATFNCSVGGVDVAARWAIAIKLSFWTYLIMSVSGLLAIAGAFVIPIRCINAVVQGCCLGTLQLAAIIYTAVVRWDQYGQACADVDNATNFPLMYTTGTFMFNMLISEIVLGGCALGCMSSSGKFKKAE